ncbi:uncharacterized protein LOC144716995 [Wolffia australiana]
MGKPAEKKRKKKGRPSLLDLQKRSLRLQKQQQEENHDYPGRKNPSPNPYLRFPNRRSARPPNEDDDDDEEEEEEGSGRRREKKLKLVLRLHHANGAARSVETRSDSDSSAPESKNDGSPESKNEKKQDGGAPPGSDPGKELCSANPQAVEGDQSDPPVITPLPDKKLLVFILDRLQKKDTYAVFSEPVDPDELPDYHDVIKHPMDFGTVRKRLTDGFYKNLEMFEKDIFLICSNAMSYNAPDTIYFRQARSIQELAKKDFENLRQDSEDDEPKIPRRGRPPGKSVAKKLAGRSPGDRASVDFSDATLANAGDNMLTWSNSSHDNSHRFLNSEASLWTGDKSADDPGSSWRMKIGKKVAVSDENRRHTYNQPIHSKGWEEPPVLAVLDGERRQLVPVGLHGEHAYARSLARFAANLGPVGWEIASRLIEKSLPPGAKFGRGWVGEPVPQRQVQPPPPPSSDTASPNAVFSARPGYGGGVVDPTPKPPFQLQHGNPVINGFNSGVTSSMVQFGRIVQATAQPVTHTGALEMVSRAGGGGGGVLYAAKDSSPIETGERQIGSANWRGLSLRAAPESTPPPDLNVRFQSPGSPPAIGVADSQQPDLALQL